MSLIQAFDIIVVDGHLYNPLHLGIMWRGLDKGSHCLTVKNSAGDVWSPEAGGILNKKISDYGGRRISVHRYKKRFDREGLTRWANRTQQRCKGYDVLAWAGFITGFRSLANDEERWTCAEFPYWMFHANGYPLTPNDEAFIYPRLFRFNPLFKEVWRGRI